MLNFLLSIPLEVRLIGLFAIGLCAGTFVNWGIYSLAWDARAISPWSRRHQDALPRRWHDLLPLAGWFSLSRETGLHGRGFWIRPLLLELFCGLGLAALYWWEIGGHLAPLGASSTLAIMPATTHAQVLAHAVLITLMLIATFIDFDEQTIPDSITIPGTLLGLLFAAILPASRLPETIPGPPPVILNLLLTSPHPWIPKLDGWRYLVIGSLIIAAWSCSLIPATATLRRGTIRGINYYIASIRRDFFWPRYVLLAALPIAGTLAVWSLGGPRWESLLTSLIGLAFGGGLVWAVRIVGRISLRREAMGFGDVTLMAMIGAFLGWQSALMVFFLSPAAALFIAVSQFLLTGRKDIAFGPYLCLAAVGVIVGWSTIWDVAGDYFALGTMIPLLVGACLMLMMGMLMFWRMFREMVFPEQDAE
ncbi:MAG: A24 family peptidase [Planctomycetales bacterium]|nr:A24 family peptidase [Planctomycetales bacterium]